MAFGRDGRGFDRVEMPSAAGGGWPSQITRAEWEALPLDQRVRAILSKKLKFFRGDKEIPMRDALEDR